VVAAVAALVGHHQLDVLAESQRAIRGLDIDVTWRPAASWTVWLGHTLSDGEVTSAPAQPDLLGKQLAQAPRDRTSAILTLDDPRLATIVGQVRYLGSQFGDDQNTGRSAPWSCSMPRRGERPTDAG
jgi:outer membrane receptor protein involved in Fe transport